MAAAETNATPPIPCSPPIGGFWTWDVKRDRVAASPGLLEFFGFSEREGAAGLPSDAYLERVVDEDRPRVQSAAAQAMAARAVFCETYRVRTPHLGIRNVRGIGRCQYDAAGEPAVFAGWFLDISEAAGALRDEALQFAFEYLTHAQAILRAAGEEMLDYLLDNVLAEFEGRRHGNAPAVSRDRLN